MIDIVRRKASIFNNKDFSIPLKAEKLFP